MDRLWLRAAIFIMMLLWGCPAVEGYFEYQAKIPNGARVPHPCKSSYLWPGVGHFNVQGGGARNQFGLDFAAAGHTWTTELCQKDSDGDGKSNGKELGDPECTWLPGQIPQFTANITHPGVCDPIQGAQCVSQAVPQNAGVSYATVGDWMQEACHETQFQCSAIDSEDAQHIDLRLPEMSVPAKETTYMCMTFQWPDITQDYHVIATEPVINNSNVLHHVLLFGCKDEFSLAAEPWECIMVGCTELLSTWGVGILGHCLHQDAGIGVGKSGFKTFMMQFHWNNPHHHSLYQDSSGMRLHYTSRLRPHNMGMLMTGQNFIHIPPRTPHTFVTSDCTPACTRELLAGDIHITSAFNHMHYLGRSMNIELHRCGRFVRNLTNELFYSYDSPKFYEFPDVVTVKPGDMIRTNCHYNSMDKASTTLFGLGTADEMCYGFISFYPKENMPNVFTCTAWKGFLDCDNATFGACTNEVRIIFSSPSFNQSDIFQDITSACSPFGVCTEECKRAVRVVRKCHPCLKQSHTWDIIRQYHLPKSEAGWQFHAAWTICDRELYTESLTRSEFPDDIKCPEGQDLPMKTQEPVYGDSCVSEQLGQSGNGALGLGGGWAVFWALVGVVRVIWGKLCLL